MRVVGLSLVLLLVGCTDDVSPADAGVPDGADGASIDATDDADAGPPPIPCKIHHDCPQTWYCYYKKCVRDPDYPVYHCGKQDSAGKDTCPPGERCVDKSGKTSVCAESTTYICNDACDCGPAHCCKASRCVKDTEDPWLPGGTGGSCEQGKDATYCSTAPSCHEGRQAFANKGLLGKFLAYDRARKISTGVCGGKRCFGTGCNCETGESCIDTLQATPLPGKVCGLLSGGSCVSNALAESVFGYKPSDLLPCCSATCPKGKSCDAGWRSDGRWAYLRIVGTCGSCGNGTCDPGEWHETCPKDCTCGDGTCGAGEAKTCFQDCAKCGNGVCDPGEMTGIFNLKLTEMGMCNADCTCGNGSCDPGEVTQTTSLVFPKCADCTCGDGVCAADEVCAKDCVCQDSHLFSDRGRICGDGSCDGAGCGRLESCLSCPADCGACAWEPADRSSRSSLPRMRSISAAWGDLTSGITVVGATDLLLGTVLRYDGTWSSSPTPLLLSLQHLWGSPTGELFATSAFGGIWRSSGAAWTPMSMPASGSYWFSWSGLWGRSASEVYAATSSDGLLRYDGNAKQQWEAFLPTKCSDVWGPPSPSDTLYLVQSDAIYRCAVSTKTCTKMSLPSTGPTQITDIWGVQTGAKLDVFVVGMAGGVPPPALPEPLVLHHDGSATGAWTQMTLPKIEHGHLALVWGRSATDIHAVGQQSKGWAGLALHYDGKAWTEVTLPVEDPIKQVWGTAKETYALGASGALLRYDDKQQAWKVLGSPAGITSYRPVPTMGVWGASATDVLAISGSEIHRYDGTRWQRDSLPDAVPIYGIWGRSAGEVYAVGGEHAAGTAAILRHDGKTWSKAAAPAKGPLYDVWGDASSLRAVGEGNGLWSYDGKTWTNTPSTAAIKRLVGLAACTATRLAAVGHTYNEEGVVALFDTAKGSATTTQVTGVSHLFDVWCDATGTIVAVGGLVKEHASSAGGYVTPNRIEPKVVTCSGLSCQVTTPPWPAGVRDRDTQKPQPRGLHGIWGPAKSDLYAVGLDGAVLHFDGKAWKPLAVDLRSTGYNWGCADLNGVWGAKDQLFIAARGGPLRIRKVTSKP